MAVGQTLQDVLEVSKRLDVIELCSGDQRGDDRPALRAAIGSREQVVLAAERDRADGALDRVVVEFDAPVIDEAAECAPTNECIPSPASTDVQRAERCHSDAPPLRCSRWAALLLRGSFACLRR